MEWVFGPDDDKAYQKASDGLIKRFSEWTKTHKGDWLADDARIALDWKWGYGDGHLVTWTLPDFDEFLLKWFPRKVSIPPERANDVLRALGSFFTFLAAERMLSNRSSSSKSIDAHLRKLAPRFEKALGKSSNFGMGKSIISAVEGMGFDIDPSDPATLQRAMAAFNALSFEERNAILGGGSGPAEPAQLPPWLADVEDLNDFYMDELELPPAPPVDLDLIDRLAVESDLFAKFARLHAFLSGGRTLTQTGNLKLADAKELVKLLGTRDRVDEQIGERQFKTASANDLPELQFYVAWARAAGVVRVAKATMSATKSWAGMRPGERYTKAVVVLLEKGPLALRRSVSKWGREALDHVVDDGATALLASMYSHPEPFDFEEFLTGTRTVVSMQIQFPPIYTDELKDRSIRQTLDGLVRVLRASGLLERSGATETTSIHGSTELHGGALEFTELGRAVIAVVLRAVGFDVPETGELCDAPFSELVAMTAEWSSDRLMTEFDVWLTHRQPIEADGEIVAAGHGADGPEDRIAIAAFVGRIGDRQRAAALMERLLETPVRAQASIWLSVQGGADASHELHGLALMENLAVMADRDDDEFVDVMRTFVDQPAFGGFLDQLWRIRQPWAGELLDAIAGHAPDAKMAKAARKALFKHRGEMAQERHSAKTSVMRPIVR